MATSFYVNGVDQIEYLRIDTLSFETQANTRATLDCEFLDTGGVIRPDISNEVIFTANERTITGRIFSGNNEFLRFTGAALTTADIGKVVVIPNAMIGGGALTSRIAYVLDANTAGLEFSAEESSGTQTIRIGNRLFAGRVVETEEQAFFADSGILTTLSCADYNEIPARITDTVHFASESNSLQHIVHWVVDNKLNPFYGMRKFGIATGPDLGPQFFDYVFCDAIFNRISELSGWIWYVDSTFTLRFHPPGEELIAFTVTTDIPLEGTYRCRKTYDQYRNYQTVLYGGKENKMFFEYPVGDGSTTEWELHATPVNSPPAPTVTIFRGASPPDEQTLGIYGVDAIEWTYRASDNKIVQTGGTVLAAGTDYFGIGYQAYYPIPLQISDPVEYPLRGHYEVVVEAPDINSYPEALALAQGLLRRYARLPRRLEFRTYQDGFEVAKGAMVNMPNRGINNTQFLIDSVTVSDDGSATLIYDVSMIEGTEFQSLWVDFFKGTGQQASGTMISGTGPGAGGGTGGGGVTYVIPPFTFWGGSRSRGVLNDANWKDVENAIPITIPGGSATTGVSVRVWVRTEHASVSVSVRIYDETDATPASAEVTSTATGVGTEVFLSFTAEAGHKYILQNKAGIASLNYAIFSLGVTL